MTKNWMMWLLVMSAVSFNVAAAATVSDLRCEQRNNPSGIDEIRPQLGWIIESDRRNEVQTACQILVASTAELHAADPGDLWDREWTKNRQKHNLNHVQKLTGIYRRSEPIIIKSRPRL